MGEFKIEDFRLKIDLPDDPIFDLKSSIPKPSMPPAQPLETAFLLTAGLRFVDHFSPYDRCTDLRRFDRFRLNGE